MDAFLGLAVVATFLGIPATFVLVLYGRLLIWRIEARVTQLLRAPSASIILSQRGLRLGTTGFVFPRELDGARIAALITDCGDERLQRLAERYRLAGSLERWSFLIGAGGGMTLAIAALASAFSS